MFVETADELYKAGLFIRVLSSLYSKIMGKIHSVKNPMSREN